MRPKYNSPKVRDFGQRGIHASTPVKRPKDNSPKVKDFGQRCVFPDGLAQRQAIGNFGMHLPIKLLRCLPATKNASSTLRS
jgi:hypothetical protein